MRVFDLFSGAAGGWSLGLHRAGYRTVAACEIDPWRRAAFLSNFPGVEMWDDVRDVSARSLRDRLGRLPDVVVGSPPCQDASAANQRGVGIDGERTGLFFEAIRIVREVAPVWCAFENVAGLRARGVERVLSGLEEAGYAAWPLVVGAVHAGAPHKRNRVWIIAANTDERRGGPWQARSERSGRVDLGARASGRAATDPDPNDLRQQPGRGSRETGTGTLFVPRTDEERDAPDSAEARYLRGQDSRADRGPEGSGQAEEGGRPTGHLEPERDGAGVWDRWNGGYAAYSRELDDGLPRGMARQCLAAFGDAVVPQITESIGRVMSRLVACPERDAAWAKEEVKR
jgi:DNA (cytosine-5)-methyltransferase 1